MKHYSRRRVNWIRCVRFQDLDIPIINTYGTMRKQSLLLLLIDFCHCSFSILSTNIKSVSHSLAVSDGVFLNFKIRYVTQGRKGVQSLVMAALQGRGDGSTFSIFSLRNL